jgi:uncharacterized membrane protein
LSDKKLVLAIFGDESLADSAAASLREWDKADKNIKMSAIGIMALDKDGHIKMEKMGRRSTLKGAGIGAVLALITPVGLVAGVAGGSLVGALHRKGLGLDREYREMVESELMDGKAAVGVLIEPEHAAEVMARMKDLGGTPEAHSLSEETLTEVDKQVSAEEHATPPAA